MVCEFGYFTKNEDYFAPSGWRAKLGDNAMADAVVDRLVFNSHVMHIEGTESMRKRMSGII